MKRPASLLHSLETLSVVTETLLTTVPLVRTVQTIGLSVADPQCWNAHRRADTAEFIGLTFYTAEQHRTSENKYI